MDILLTSEDSQLPNIDAKQRTAVIAAVCRHYDLLYCGMYVDWLTGTTVVQQ